MPFADPDKRREYDHRKYLRNRQKILERVKEYGKRNRAKISAHYRVWREANNRAYNEYHRYWRKHLQSKDSKERQRETTREWYRRNSKRMVERNRRHRARNKIQYVASQAVWAATVCGLLVRPNTCTECGTTCKPHAHHKDYKHLLEVVWLCHHCHLKAHNGSFNNPPAR